MYSAIGIGDTRKQTTRQPPTDCRLPTADCRLPTATKLMAQCPAPPPGHPPRPTKHRRAGAQGGGPLGPIMDPNADIDLHPRPCDVDEMRSEGHERRSYPAPHRLGSGGSRVFIG